MKFHHKSRQRGLKVGVRFAGMEGVAPCYETAAQEVLFTPLGESNGLLVRGYW